MATCLVSSALVGVAHRHLDLRVRVLRVFGCVGVSVVKKLGGFEQQVFEKKF